MSFICIANTVVAVTQSTLSLSLSQEYTLNCGSLLISVPTDVSLTRGKNLTNINSYGPVLQRTAQVDRFFQGCKQVQT